MNPAFAYFYDEFLNEKKYEKLLNEVEAEIANKNIGGRIARLAMFRNPQEMMEDLMLGGAKNIVVVGDDTTLKKVIASSQNFDPVFGYLPMGKSNDMADLLGIQRGKVAVDILAGRYIEKLDIGKINDGFFLKEILIKDPRSRVAIEGQFEIRPSENGMMVIRNVSLPDIRHGEQETIGKLELEVIPEVEGTRREKREAQQPKTKLAFHQARILGDAEITISVDGQTLRGQAFDVTLIPKKLKCITGRRFISRTEKLIA